MRPLLVSALVLASLFYVVPWSVHKGTQLRTAHRECARAHVQNAVILASTECSDPWQRHVHAGGKQEAVCREAAKEQDSMGDWLWLCAWNRMWLDSGPLQLWTMITSSYWILAAVLVSSACTAIYLSFQTCAQKRALRVQSEMWKETLSMLNKGSVPLQLQPQQPQQRRRGILVEEEDEDGDYIKLVTVP